MKGSFLWHVDAQPNLTFKVMIYLEDVGPENGPFSYMPGTQKEYNGFPQFGRTRRKDQNPKSFHQFTGKRGDAMIFNVNGWHMGGRCERRSRLVLVVSVIPSKIPWRDFLNQYGFAVVPEIENYIQPERIWWTK
jgi:ectoine hydroxylase-related dioxygenase (phytanoyl-CoA dioxygenase family)